MVTQGDWGQTEQNRTRPTRAAAAMRDGAMGQEGPMSTSSFVLCFCFATLLFLSSCSFLSELSLFFVEYNNRWGSAGRDGTGRDKCERQQQRGKDQGVGWGVGAMFISIFFFSNYLFFNKCSTTGGTGVGRGGTGLFYVKYNNRREGAEEETRPCERRWQRKTGGG